MTMVVERLTQPDCNGGYLPDGFPRTIGQAELLRDRLAAARHSSTPSSCWWSTTPS